MNIGKFLTDAFDAGVSAVTETGQDLMEASQPGSAMTDPDREGYPRLGSNQNPSTLQGSHNYPSGITGDPLGFINYMPYEHGQSQSGSKTDGTSTYNAGEVGEGPLQVNIHMPSEMQDDITAKWDAEEDLFAKASQLGIKESAMGSAFKLGKDLLGDAGAELAEKVTLGGIDADTAKKSVDRRLGHAVRPFESQFFGGVDYRTFSFTHKLIAFERSDTITINKIIKTFRYHSSPGLALNGLAYKYPSSWRIRFFHADPKNTANVKESLWLPTIKRCVLTKVGVNHFNSDTPTYHDNLAPVDIELSLEFQEAEFVTKESILKETQPVW